VKSVQPTVIGPVQTTKPSLQASLSGPSQPTPCEVLVEEPVAVVVERVADLDVGRAGVVADGGGAGADLHALGAEVAVRAVAHGADVEAVVGRAVAVLVQAVAADLGGGAAGGDAALPAGAARAADPDAVALALADADAAGGAEVEAVVELAVAVLVDVVATDLGGGVAGDRVALGGGAAGRADLDAVALAGADAGAAGGADVEAVVGRAVAVLVEAVAADLGGRAGGDRVALGGGAAGHADLAAVALALADAGAAGGADVEAVVGHAVAVLVEAVAADLGASGCLG
jgi:hypothetical protein